MNMLELKIPPPAVALAMALLMWLTPAFAGLVPLSGLARLLGAVLLASAGLGVAFAGVAAFRRAGTTVKPTQADRASALVVAGVYRFTRNPMYLGFLLTLLAWAVWLANPVAVVWVVVCALYITRFQILPEERVLSLLFGAEYETYKGRVRRWV